MPPVIEIFIFPLVNIAGMMMDCRSKVIEPAVPMSMSIDFPISFLG